MSNNGNGNGTDKATAAHEAELRRNLAEAQAVAARIQADLAVIEEGRKLPDEPDNTSVIVFDLGIKEPGKAGRPPTYQHSASWDRGRWWVGGPHAPKSRTGLTWPQLLDYIGAKGGTQIYYPKEVHKLGNPIPKVDEGPLKT